MSALRRKLGDVYRISLTDGNFGFMQHVANDATQLGSAVVLVLRKTYPPSATFAFEKELVRDGFFAHVFLKAGKILHIWEHFHWLQPVVQGPIPVIWAICSVKDMQLDTSRHWKLWRTNDEMHAPSSQEELTNAELGLVISPPQIVQRIEHGAYLIRYPRRILVA
ncbi:MAG: hypothetical protein ABSD02_22290 [Steroidobacteraceae bacterium]